MTAPTAAPSPTPTATARAAAKKVEAPRRPALPAPPTLDEPLSPLTRPFVKVTLPGVKDALISVSGKGPKDLYFLAAESHKLRHGQYMFYRGTVIHSDGSKVLDTQVPCEGYHYDGLVAGGDEVLVLGSNMYYRNVPGRYLATLSGKKSWSCGGGYARGFAVSSGGRAWMLTCDHAGTDCTLGATGMPRVRLPRWDPAMDSSDRPSASIEAVWMRGADDGWLIHDGGDGRAALLRYNGVSWSTKATFDGLAVTDLWVDEGNQVWIVARRGGKDDAPGNALLRFDGNALEELRLPASFAASMVRGTGGKDIWFVGAGTAVYQWDGQKLHAGQAPFIVGGAWAAPGGELWIVGPDDEVGAGPGVTAHTARPAAEVR